jgi:hypothetical protein
VPNVVVKLVVVLLEVPLDVVVPLAVLKAVDVALEVPKVVVVFLEVPLDVFLEVIGMLIYL